MKWCFGDKQNSFWWAQVYKDSKIAVVSVSERIARILFLKA